MSEGLGTAMTLGRIGRNRDQVRTCDLLRISNRATYTLLKALEQPIIDQALFTAFRQAGGRTTVSINAVNGVRVNCDHPSVACTRRKCVVRCAEVFVEPGEDFFHDQIIRRHVAGLEDDVLLVGGRGSQSLKQRILRALYGEEVIVAAVDHQGGLFDTGREVKRIAFRQRILLLDEDREFIDKYTTGWDEVVASVQAYDPRTAAEMTGVPPDAIEKAAHWMGKSDRVIAMHARGLERRIPGHGVLLLTLS